MATQMAAATAASSTPMMFFFALLLVSRMFFALPPLKTEPVAGRYGRPTPEEWRGWRSGLFLALKFLPSGVVFLLSAGVFSNFPLKAKERAESPVTEKSRGSAFSTVIIPSLGGTK